MTATTATVTTPSIGPSLLQVWKPPVGVTPGSAGDATAPFKLGYQVTTNDGTQKLAVFARAAGAVTDGGTVGITSGGVTTTAASGNTYTNNTGVALVTGDYAFFMTQGVTTP